jgi:hypothetical protein
VFAVEANGKATRLACDPKPDSPLFLNAELGSDALTLEVQYNSDRPSTIVKVPRR